MCHDLNAQTHKSLATAA